MLTRLWQFAALCLIALTSSCATLNSPHADLIDTVPVVELGQPAPADKDYILLLRQGQDIPVTLDVSGSFLAQGNTVQTRVKIKHDIYLYKKWSSLDGKNWTRKNVKAVIASGLDPAGGKVTVTVDELPKP
jgi:hypothetical protein